MLLIKIIKGNHEYAFYGSDISICPGTDEPIRVTDAEVYKDGKPEEDLGESFDGHHFDAEEATQSVIRAYINNDRSMRSRQVLAYISNFLEEFFEKNIHLREEYKSLDGKTHSRWIPMKYFGSSGILPLQIVDADGCAYYSDGDEFVVTRKDGSLATDYEFLYENSMTEALEEGNCKYMSDEIKAYLRTAEVL